MRAAPAAQWWKSTLLLVAAGCTLGGAAWLSLQQVDQVQTSGGHTIHQPRSFTHQVKARTRAS